MVREERLLGGMACIECSDEALVPLVPTFYGTGRVGLGGSSDLSSVFPWRGEMRNEC